MNMSMGHSSTPVPCLRSFAKAMMDVETKKAFFFDFDGTLCDTAPTPGLTSVAPELPTLLGALETANCGCVAVLTGRPIAVIDEYLAPNRLPGAGQHGLEVRLAEGTLVQGRDVHDLDAARRCLSAHSPLPKGIEIEDKGLSIALHYRSAPELAGFVDALIEGVVSLSSGFYREQRGEFVSEITFVGGSKGAALRMLMTSPQFIDRVPVFFGSDPTDGELVGVVHGLGGLVARVGPSAWDGADATLSGSPDVHWLIRDFVAEHGISSASRPRRSA
jgi:trehalose 6-phosphate phosphatase